MFECVVIFGYLVGIAGKFVTMQRTNILPYSTWFYFLDIIMVSFDLILTIRNKRLDRLNQPVME